MQYAMFSDIHGEAVAVNPLTIAFVRLRAKGEECLITFSGAERSVRVTGNLEEVVEKLELAVMSDRKPGPSYTLDNVG